MNLVTLRSMRTLTLALYLVVLPLKLAATSILIPMDEVQTDHLKAYGVVYRALDQGYKAEWLLNYRAGSFLIEYSKDMVNMCLLMGVTQDGWSSKKRR